MSSQPRNDDGPDLEEVAEEEELLILEKEVEQIAQKILDYRTTLPAQLSSTISLLETQRPVLPTHLLDEAVPQPEAGVTKGLLRETTGFPVTDDSDEAVKIQLLKQKISSNATAVPVVLNRMKEYMARIDKLDSSNGIIHPAFKRKRTS
ncbi:hypothetical protein C2S52_018391 [Perilla frutescens var. hirtella]|nr:hypothetical protein C2S52_018391 [Perilla frutescens var. hirtella]KAH6812103.1 hypothetical protein C2S51_025865 [Perilla frutescens var. frutescens]